MPAVATTSTVTILPPRKVSKASDWQRQLADSYKNPHDLLRDLGLSGVDAVAGFDAAADTLFKTRVPKSFAQKMQRGNPNDPLLLQVLPQSAEFSVAEGFSTDPLAEKDYNPLPGLLHKYSSRVLLTLQGACAINCRYCFRRHFDYGENRINTTQLEAIIAYIAEHPTVNEVVLSGGDPLMGKDNHLADLITKLEALPQLKRLRLHTRLPVVIPERITNELTQLLASTHLQSVIVLHCNHPNEIDDNFTAHVQKLTNNGVQVFNQSVLLKNINDNADVLVALSEKLFAGRVLPYYLFLLDKVSGVGHFEVDEARARQLIRQVAAQLPGYLVPKLARETAGLASKDMWV